MTLDRSHRRRILKALVFDRPVEPADEPFARDRASSISSRLPHALFMGVISGLFMGSNVHALFPLTPSNLVILILGVLSVLTYAICIAVALRISLWLRKRT